MIGTGELAGQIVRFARILRAAGLPIGSGSILDALNAVDATGIGTRDDLYWTLHAVFVKRHEQSPVFEEAFRLFFRRRDPTDEIHGVDQSAMPPIPEEQRTAQRRVQEAMAEGRMREVEREEEQREFHLSVSDQEVLQKKDFAQMSAAELAEALAAIAKLRLPLSEVRTRRLRPDPKGRRVNLRQTLRASMKTGGGVIDLRWLGRKTQPPPIVALLDISGSMNEYTRLFLHFLHAVSDARKRVSVFLFGTRLTNVTRALKHKDPDAALAACSGSVQDWSGGTRIAPSLHEFNRHWARRVLGQGAIVLLITDGLEREGGGALAFEMDRLHRSCRRLIWLNPLLRFRGFEAKAGGIRTMLAHVDDFRPIHNLQSMEDLVAALSDTHSSRTDPRAYLRGAA